MHESLLSEAVVLLGAGLLMVMLFRRFGLGAVLGYLVAGAIIGPHGLGLAGGGESKLAIAEIGIALLLFLVGLELNPARLWHLKRNIFGLGLVQVLAHLGLGLGPIALAYGLVDRRLGMEHRNGIAQAQARKLAAKPLSSLIETKRLMKKGQADQVTVALLTPRGAVVLGHRDVAAVCVPQY